MTLSAHTNAVGTHTQWGPNKCRCVNPNGSIWNGDAGDIALAVSKKSSPSYPTWIKRNGIVQFKTPSNYERYVFRRNNPSFTSVDTKQGGLITTCDMTSAWRLGTYPNQSIMPGLFNNNFPEVAVDENALNRCVIDCYLKIKDQKAQIGNALAEAKQTVDMVAKATSTLVKLLLHAKRGNFKGMANDLGLTGRDALRLPANTYLQWKYGWAPLMSDIHDGVELLKNQFPPMLPLLHAKRTIKQDKTWTDRWWVSSNYATITGKGTNLSKVELWVTCDVDPWRQAALRMGLDDPLGILWEVTPWSFVVDWVSPVGDFLSALSVMKDLTFVAGYWLTVNQGSSRITHPGDGDPRVTESVPPVTIDRFGMRRNAMSGLPMPLPYIKSPFSTSHTASALALLVQLFR